MIKNYLKVAWRNLNRKRLSSIINIVGLTIGISVFVLILIFVRYESTFDGFHEKSDRIFRVVQHNSLPDQTSYWNTTAYPLAEALCNDIKEIDIVTQIAGPVNRVFEINNDGKNQNLFEEPSVLFVDSFYPKTFDLKWLAGDSNTALNEMNSVVLTEKLAKRYFGADSQEYNTIIGKTIHLQSKDPLLVTGVIGNPKGNSDHQYNMLIPYEFFKVNNQFFSSNWSGNYQGTTYVVLNKNTDIASLEANISNWKSKYLKPTDDKRISYHLQPITEIHNETRYGPSPGGYVMPNTILTLALVVGLFILLVAVVNFVNLVTAQSHSRSKEVGIRKVMGSNRLQLVKQFIFEHSLLVIFAALCSILVVHGLIGLLNEHFTLISLNLEFHWQHLGFIAIVVFLVIGLSTVYPSLVLSAYRPVQALKNKFIPQKGASLNLRKALVTIQFVIVQLFVIASIILAFQMNLLKNSDFGFSKEAVVITKVPDQEKAEVYRTKLLADAQIANVSFGSGPPMAVNGLQLGTSYRLPEQPEEQSLDAEMKVGDINYLDFYNMELLAGRNFTSSKENFDEFIVNETFLKTYHWNPEEAIGKKIQINEGLATIVGVVKDFNNNSLQYEISSCIIINWTYFQDNAFIKINKADNTVLKTIEGDWRDTFKKAVFDLQFLDDAIAKEYAVEEMVFMGFGIFSGLSILIGCLGLFGLMSFIVNQKRKEIGIRKVLGASLLENTSLFLKEYVGLVLLSFLIAAPIAYHFINQWLEVFTYRIQPSIWMFLTGGILTISIALITSSFQSIKASLANPINALREE